MELEEDTQQDLSEGGFLKPKALVGSRQWAVSWLNCNCESALESRESGTSRPPLPEKQQSARWELVWEFAPDRRGRSTWNSPNSRLLEWSCLRRLLQ
ncbi:UNVERIFIED_CONTAM: hypothetical protein FKN15_004420 [Acipenser sinensis]